MVIKFWGSLINVLKDKFRLSELWKVGWMSQRLFFRECFVRTRLSSVSDLMTLWETMCGVKARAIIKKRGRGGCQCRNSRVSKDCNFRISVNQELNLSLPTFIPRISQEKFLCNLAEQDKKTYFRNCCHMWDFEFSCSKNSHHLGVRTIIATTK